LESADNVEFRKRIAVPARDLGDEIWVAVDGAPVDACFTIVTRSLPEPQIDDRAEIHRDAESIKFASLRLRIVTHSFLAFAIGLQLGDDHPESGLPFERRR